MTDKPRHHRFRIRLRAFMLLVLVLGVWLGMQVNKVRRQKEAAEAVREYGGQVYYDYEFVNGNVRPGRQPRGPRWLRRKLGDEYFREIAGVFLVYDDASEKQSDDLLSLLSSQHGIKTLLVHGGNTTDKGLAHLARLTQLEGLYLDDSPEITDEGLESIQRMANLKNLRIVKTKVTDRGFLALSGMSDMKCLYLLGHSFTDRGFSAVAEMDGLTVLCVGGSKDRPSRITDDGLSLVARMKKLENLSLSHSQVTDKGLIHLKGLIKLEVLDLEGCKVSDEGLRNLSDLKNLKCLYLSESDVSDEGLKHVRDLPKLGILTLYGSKVTEKAKQELKKGRPSLIVY